MDLGVTEERLRSWLSSYGVRHDRIENEVVELVTRSQLGLFNHVASIYESDDIGQFFVTQKQKSTWLKPFPPAASLFSHLS